MSMRSYYFFGFLMISFILVSSFYIQLFENFIPCPLCVLQRLTFALLGFVFLFGIITAFSYRVRLSTNVLALLFSLLGLFLAGRQIWLQQFPPADATECSVSLQYMMQVLPMNEVVQKMFAGT